MSPDARRTKRYEDSTALSKRAGAGRKSRGQAATGSSVRTLLGGWVLNPYLAFFLLLGVGVATFRLEHQLRLTVLWLLLLGIVLLYAETGRLKASYSLLNLARGALLGLIVALPLYLFVRDFFQGTAVWLYGVSDWQVLLERAAILVPIVEGVFFRGMVQRERSLLDGAILFAVAQGLYVVHAASQFPVVVVSIVLGMGLIGVLYGYLNDRYGLTASIACHAAVNMVLFVLPALAERVNDILSF
jgi:membrane protease YdiL (CAAX protease family)